MVPINSFVVFDTSIFIGYLRNGHYQEKMENVNGLVRTSSVVLAELWREAMKSAEFSFLRTLERNHPVLVPTEQNWQASGELLGQMRSNLGITVDKLRNLHFDVLIALTALSHGARLITADRADFELIKSRKFARDLKLEIW